MRKVEVKRSCLSCNTEFTTRQWRVNQGKGKFCSRKCYNNWNQSDRHWRYRGHKKSNGYEMLVSPHSPLANCRGYAPEHRLIMERKLGRGLVPNEIVHHIDLDKTNNSPDNLVVLNNGEHANYHRQINRLFEHWLGG